MVKKDTFVLRNGDVVYLSTTDKRVYTYAFYKPKAKKITDYASVSHVFFWDEPKEAMKFILLIHQIKTTIVKHFNGDFRKEVLNFQTN